MSTSESSAPAAGWYPDPDGSGEARYWDGSSWTEDRKPLRPGRSAKRRRIVKVGVAALVVLAAGIAFAFGAGAFDTKDSAERGIAQTTVATRSSRTTSTSASPTRTDSAPSTEPPTNRFDLGIPGTPMSSPPCDGEYIVHVAAAVNPANYAPAVASALQQHPGSAYVRTDQSCSSFKPDQNGNPIYSIYYGPYPSREEACLRVVQLGGYVKLLANTSPTGPEAC